PRDTLVRGLDSAKPGRRPSGGGTGLTFAAYGAATDQSSQVVCLRRKGDSVTMGCRGGWLPAAGLDPGGRLSGRDGEGRGVAPAPGKRSTFRRSAGAQPGRRRLP